MPPWDYIDTAVMIDPTTGVLMIAEGGAVALGCLVWIAALVMGLATSWLVLP